MNDRIKKIIPNPPEDYEAYLYIWRIWIEEKSLWKYYVGRKGVYSTMPLRQLG